MQKIILIDDSDIFRKTWDLEAEINNINIISFATASSFKENMSNYDKNIPVFIDINLSENIDGIMLAEQLYAIGFKIIFLLTGDSISNITKPSYVQEIFDKLMPFNEIKEKILFIQKQLRDVQL